MYFEFSLIIKQLARNFTLLSSLRATLSTPVGGQDAINTRFRIIFQQKLPLTPMFANSAFPITLESRSPARMVSRGIKRWEIKSETNWNHQQRGGWEGVDLFREPASRIDCQNFATTLLGRVALFGFGVFSSFRRVLISTATKERELQSRDVSAN